MTRRLARNVGATTFLTPAEADELDDLVGRLGVAGRSGALRYALARLVETDLEDDGAAVDRSGELVRLADQLRAVAHAVDVIAAHERREASV